MENFGFVTVAYGLIWVVFFAYLVYLNGKLSRIEARLDREEGGK